MMLVFVFLLKLLPALGACKSLVSLVKQSTFFITSGDVLLACHRCSPTDAFSANDALCERRVRILQDMGEKAYLLLTRCCE